MVPEGHMKTFASIFITLDALSKSWQTRNFNYSFQHFNALLRAKTYQTNDNDDGRREQRNLTAAEKKTYQNFDFY